MGADPQDVDSHTDWYTWTHDRKNIEQGVVSGDLPEEGPGFWRRYAQDLKLASDDLKNNAVRLSMEWSRIFPESTAEIPVDVKRDSRGYILAVNVSRDSMKELERHANLAAVKRYREIFQEAARRDLTIMLTLNHFTLPDWLHDPIGCRDNYSSCARRGWLDPRTVIEFAKYAAFAGKTFGDLVDIWATINEPMVVSVLGYFLGPEFGFPPALSDPLLVLEATKNLAMAHALAYEQLKKWDAKSSTKFGSAYVGVVVNPQVYEPHDPKRSWDVEAARSTDYIQNEWYLNAALRGEYDMNFNMLIEPEETVPALVKGCDFLGVNYYQRIKMKGTESKVGSLRIGDPVPPRENMTDMGSEIYPPGIRMTVNWIYRTYRRPIFITENGIADAKDEKRTDFLRQHLIELKKAIEEGVPVRGYFYWSLIDNFEWALGFEKRFGLFTVNYKTKQRTPTKAVQLYRKMSATNALP